MSKKSILEQIARGTIFGALTSAFLLASPVFIKGCQIKKYSKEYENIKICESYLAECGDTRIKENLRYLAEYNKVMVDENLKSMLYYLKLFAYGCVTPAAIAVWLPEIERKKKKKKQRKK
jgi:hypothetical protein